MRIHPIALSVVAMLALGAAAPAQNLFKRAQSRRSIIADPIATQVGDILTVTIQEISRVKNEDKVDRSNTTSLAARVEDYTLSSSTFKTNVLPQIDIRQARSERGEARQEKDVSVIAAIAVIVVDVQPNGNLVVAGSRTVELDDEVKTFKISGLVRPLDIERDNRVASSQVADARISIVGEGGNTRHTTRGPIATAFQTLIWAAWPF